MLVNLNTWHQSSWSLQCWLLVKLLLNKLSLLLLKTFWFFLGRAIDDRILIAIILFIVLWVIKLLALDSLLNGAWHVGLLYSLDYCRVLRVNLLRMLLWLQTLIIIKEISLDVVIACLGLNLMNSFSWGSFLLCLGLIKRVSVAFHLKWRLLGDPDSWLASFV